MIFHDFYFFDSKKLRETCIIKGLPKLTNIQHYQTFIFASQWICWYLIYKTVFSPYHKKALTATPPPCYALLLSLSSVFPFWCSSQCTVFSSLSVFNKLCPINHWIAFITLDFIIIIIIHQHSYHRIYQINSVLPDIDISLLGYVTYMDKRSVLKFGVVSKRNCQPFLLVKDCIV